MGVSALIISGAIIIGQLQLISTHQLIVAKFNLLLAAAKEYLTMYVFD